MADYSDVTFTSMVRFDSPERIHNFKITKRYLTKNFPTAKTLFCEHDDNPTDQSLDMFIPIPHGMYHHRTRVMNILAKAARTPIIVSYDIDAIIPPQQLRTAITAVRAGDAACNPYTKLKHVEREQCALFYSSLRIGLNGIEGKEYTGSWQKVYKRFRDIVDLSEFSERFAPVATGLVIVHQRSMFLAAGGCNENLLGHASEEMERYMRFKKLGFRWSRIGGWGYHMHHPRGPDDFVRNRHYEHNMHEIGRVLQMDKPTLKKYVETWSWVNESTNESTAN